MFIHVLVIEFCWECGWAQIEVETVKGGGLATAGAGGRCRRRGTPDIALDILKCFVLAAVCFISTFFLPRLKHGINFAFQNIMKNIFATMLIQSREWRA